MADGEFPRLQGVWMRENGVMEFLPLTEDLVVPAYAGLAFDLLADRHYVAAGMFRFRPGSTPGNFDGRAIYSVVRQPISDLVNSIMWVKNG